MTSVYLEIYTLSEFEFKVMPVAYLKPEEWQRDFCLVISREEWELQGCE